MVILSTAKAQQQIGKQLRSLRLQQGLTQAGLAKRSGVKLPTLRKFEQKGMISLESFLKLLIVFNKLQPLVAALEPPKLAFNSISEVLQADTKKERQKGWRT